MKQDKYLALHRLKNNGNLPLIKNLVPLILAKEQDEVLLHFPEYKDRVEKIDSILNEIYTDLDNKWYCYWDEKNQKKFALGIKDSPAASILFNARRMDEDWKELWKKSDDLLIRIVEERLGNKTC